MQGVGELIVNVAYTIRNFLTYCSCKYAKHMNWHQQKDNHSNIASNKGYPKIQRMHHRNDAPFSGRIILLFELVIDIDE